MAQPTLPLDVRPPDDATLLTRLCAGDEDAFDTIFRTWYAPLVRFATRTVGNRARAEEVVQDAMLALWRRRESLETHTSAQAWLFHVTRNCVLNLLRHDAIAARAAPRLVSTFQLAARASAADATGALLEAELSAAIDAAVAALPPRCREVFILSRFHGLRQTHIAERLGVSVKAVEAHTSRALRQLRVSLAPWIARDTRD